MSTLKKGCEVLGHGIEENALGVSVILSRPY
jgi:hypothetical protein